MTTRRPRYTMAINGAAPALLEDLGWSLDSLTLRSLGADEVQLSRVRRPGGSLGLAFEDAVVIYRDAEPIFRGTAMPPATTSNAQTSAATVTLRNWWWQAMDLTWCYTPWGPLEVGDIITAEGGSSFRMDYVDFPGTTPPTREFSRYYTADSSLFPGTAGTWDKTVRGELQFVLAYLRDHLPAGTVAFDPLTWELPGVTPEPRERRVTDRRVADLLTEVMATMPAAFLVTDYTATATNIRAVDASQVEAVQIRHGQAGLKGHSLSPLPELRVKGVILRTPWTGFAAGFSRPFAYSFGIYHYPLLTARLGRPGMLVVSLDDLSGDYAGYDDFGALLAQQLYEQLNPLRSRGTLEWHDPGQALGIRPGMKFSLYDAELDFGELLVQEVTHTPANGRTVAQVGYPRALGLQELRDIKGWMRFAFYGQAALGSKPTVSPPV